MVSELTSKHKERWRVEVEIMLRLEHPNVVAAMKLPAVLLRRDDELPPMAMEYCSGGDLRKVICYLSFKACMKCSKQTFVNL